MPSTPEFQVNNVWGQNTAEDFEAELTTPSGQTCRARKLSIPSLIQAGILSEADALTASVTKYTKKVKGQKEPVVDESKLLADPAMMTTLLSMVDKAVVQIVVSPPLALHVVETKVGKTLHSRAIPEDERTPWDPETGEGFVYTDQISFEDKMFLFDWSAGGLQSMLAFRG